VVTHQPPVERGTGKVRRSKTSVLPLSQPLCNAASCFEEEMMCDKQQNVSETGRSTVDEIS